MILWLFDLLLAVTLVALAWRILAAQDLFQSVVLFIVFGLMMAIAWSRLQAFDIALAEAAIGAGLTGALLLHTLARIGEDSPRQGTRHLSQLGARPPAENVKDAPSVAIARGTRTDRPPTTGTSHRSMPAWRQPARLSLIGLFLLMMALPLVNSVQQVAYPEVGLRELVLAHMDQSGVSHPITAVLLNFRAYDTLLEMGVLLVAVLGAWSLGSLPEPARPAAPPERLLVGLVRLFAPLILLVAGYILWAGSGQPGGAFQAGAILTAAGVLLVVSGVLRPPTLRPLHQRLLLLCGLLIFLGAALGVLPAGYQFLQYPPEQSGGWILLIETALTVSIALTLLSLFVGGPRDAERPPSQERERSPAASIEERP
jgi:multisubunit Na+/H+ antiporter MnhB subunit